MQISKIDLYEYFKIQKPEHGQGILTSYVINNTPEINESRRRPAMLVIPGGGYVGCSAREAEPLALKYNSYGFSSFVLIYSCAPVRYPYPLLEAIMAMQYIRENAEKFEINPEMIAAVGFSAGGHLCGMLGTYEKREEVYNLFKHSDNVKPNAIILGYPVITYRGPRHKGSFDNLCGENEDLKNQLSIETLVNKNSAPAFIWATRDDGCVPAYNSLAIAMAYANAGVPYSIHVWGQGTHGLSLGNIVVYREESQLSGMTKSVPSWCDLSLEWLEEIGLKVQ